MSSLYRESLPPARQGGKGPIFLWVQKPGLLGPTALGAGPG